MVLDATDRDPAPRRGIDAAGVLSAAGIVAAGATALTGLNDWTVSNDQDRRVGLFHGLLNTVALGLQGASLGTRVAGHRGTARALGAASLAVTAAAGYLGGHLVFTKGVMVSRVAWAIEPRRWTRALQEADLPTIRRPRSWLRAVRSCCTATAAASTPSTTSAATQAACSAAARSQT